MSLDVPAVSGIIAVVSVVIGFLIAILRLRDLVKARQTELVMRLYETFDSREFQEAWVETLRMEFTDYKDYLRKYGATSAKPSYVSVNMVAGFFEGLGILLKRKLIDIALVDDLFSSDIMLGWHKLKPIIDGWRKQFNRPSISEWFEYLHDEMQKREEQLAQASAGKGN